MTHPLLIVVSAPSGGGKTTVCEQLLAADANLTRAITCTTRQPRGSERDGVDYYFLSETEFARRRDGGDLLEHATVHGRSYGTPRAEVLDKLGSGRDVLLNVDVQGAAAVRRTVGRDETLRNALVTVFLTPSTLEVLEQRLRRRGTESEEALQARLGRARQEIRHAAEFDYLLLSTSVSEDLRRMRAIVEAERMRTWRSSIPEV